MKKYCLFIIFFLSFLGCNNSIEKEDEFVSVVYDTSLFLYIYNEDGVNLIDSKQYDPSLLRTYYLINGEYELYHDASKASPYGYSVVFIDKESDEAGLGSYIICDIFPYITNKYHEGRLPGQTYYTINVLYDYGDTTSDEIEATVIREDGDIIIEDVIHPYSNHILTNVRLNQKLEVERDKGILRLILTK